MTHKFPAEKRNPDAGTVYYLQFPPFNPVAPAIPFIFIAEFPAGFSRSGPLFNQKAAFIPLKDEISGPFLRGIR
jgi:hypothetical protein